VSAHTHLAGVIPVANLKSDFELDTPPFLLPIAPAFTAIQKSIFECAMAGCQTIWIAANDDVAPILRKHIGEWVFDPVHYKRDLTKFYSEVRKEIPIYYAPIHPKDRDKRDSYGWSVLYGMYSAWLVSYKISKWLVPDKFFISFPMGVYDIYSLRQHRKAILSQKSNFFLMHEGKTVKNNEHLSFTMFGEDFKKCRRSVNKKTTRGYLRPGPDEVIPSKKLPIEERWSARFFNFEDVFEEIDETNASKVEVEWYYDISNWEGYKGFLASEHTIEKPYKGLTGPYRHAKMCMEVEENES
jgi:hypothetical protein